LSRGDKMAKKNVYNQPGERGMFYNQRLCPICGKLIVTSNPKSYEGANSELGRKLKEHKLEHQVTEVKDS